MTTSANPSPRSLFGTFVTRPPAADVPLGTLYTDTANIVYECMPVAGVHTWVAIGGAGGGGTLPFLVGPNGLAPYTSFATAINDAQTAGARVVYALAGNYAESFTLPANMEIYGLAESPAVRITGNIGINGVNGTNALTNIAVNGRVSFRTNSGGATTAMLQFDHVDVLASASAAFLIADSTGLTVTMRDSTFQGAANPGLDSNVSATITAERCLFVGDATNPGISVQGGSITHKDCTIIGLSFRTRAATTVDMTNAIYTLMGASSTALDLFAGTNCRIHNWVRFENQDPTGTLNSAGTVIVDGDVFLGTYLVANLPTGTIADGATAYANNLAIATPALVYHGVGQWRRFSDNTVAS